MTDVVIFSQGVTIHYRYVGDAVDPGDVALYVIDRIVDNATGMTVETPKSLTVTFSTELGKPRMVAALEGIVVTETNVHARRRR